MAFSFFRLFLLCAASLLVPIASATARQRTIFLPRLLPWQSHPHPTPLSHSAATSSSRRLAAQPQAPLVMPAGRPLKVVVLSDIHYGEAQSTLWGPEQDVLSTLATGMYLDKEKPDFVVVLGDIVTGEDMVDRVSAPKYVGAMLQPVAQRGIPFACAYGNHDIGPFLPRSSVFAYEKASFPSLSRTGRTPGLPGITNYALSFRSATQPRTAVRFVFLDSLGNAAQSSPAAMDWVSQAQVQWLNATLSAAPAVPTYVFVHIPPRPFQPIQNAFGAHRCVGLKAEPSLAVQGLDRGLWAVLWRHNNVVSVMSGHDHGSAWCCSVAPSGRRTRPLAACFARHSGYGGYGDWPRGARVLLIDEKVPFKVSSYVSLQFGSAQDTFTQ